MKRYLDKKESGEAGIAVGVILGLSERLLNGDMNFTAEDAEKLANASEVFSDFSPEEQQELLMLGLVELRKESVE